MNASHVIKTPHLPKGKVTRILIGERYRSRLEAPLKCRGIEVLWIPDNPDVDPRLGGHADLSVIHMGDNLLVAERYTFVNLLTIEGLEIKLAAAAQGAEYPADSGLNGCILDDALIHNPLYTDRAVLENLSGRKIITVNQGYAKCAVCVINERAIIASDAGICRAAAKFGIDALLISPGHIVLDGFDCGFIGGSTFKLSRHELAFTGRLHGHPDETAILNYLSEKAVSPVFLSERPIFDIGSAIPLFES